MAKLGTFCMALMLVAILPDAADARGPLGELQAGLQLDLGLSRIKDENVVQGDPKTTATTVGFGVTAAYVTPFFLLVEAAISLQDDTPLIGNDSSFSLFTRRLLVGAEVPISEQWKAFAKAGRLHYDLDPKERENPDVVILPRSGGSNVYEFGARLYSEDRRGTLSATLRDFTLPDGHSRTLSFGFTANF